MGKKKIFSTRVDEDRIKELKHLAVDTDKSLGTLLEEAIQDLLKKYKKKPPKPSK
ncbi:MAG: ribbon-helix-helix domain-containing protein [Deltaproteobacteria bacterium]|nr:ribbon-helix-helix domain-containing protein [Deltaproteobacteria bacterium]MBW2310181.1 ribbon-helix-helix domain-containing protein [Deltaproteobacteria bacterium]